MKYRKGDTIVDAEQFDPHSHPWPAGVVAWQMVGYQPRDMSWGFIDTAEGRAHVLFGDWIVREETGKAHLYSDAEFKGKYEKMSDNKGIAGHFLMGEWNRLTSGEMNTPPPMNHYASDVPWVPGIAIVGEPGPEIIHLPEGAQVHPNDKPEVVFPLSEKSQITILPFMSLDQLRAFVDERVRKVLEEDARAIQQNPAFQPTSISVHEHRRVEMFEESGKQWRGMLYRVEPMPSEQIPAGKCWACGESGKAEEMMWHERGGRSHLIHATAECIKAAEMKPETREHRG